MNNAATPSLRQTVQDIYRRTSTDEELALELLNSEAFASILQLGGCTVSEAAEVLGYKTKRSVESMAQKSAAFPKAIVRENVWSKRQLQTYKEERGRKK